MTVQEAPFPWSNRNKDRTETIKAINLVKQGNCMLTDELESAKLMQDCQTYNYFN